MENSIISPQKLVVTKHNFLIEASYKLSLNELRLIHVCISRLDARKPFPKDNLFVVTAIEFAKKCGIEEKHAYKALDEASSSLYEKDIRTYNGKNRERFRWVCGVKYHDSEGKVSLSFSQRIIPYLSMLHDKITSYDLKQISELKSVYSFRLFEFFIRFKSTGKFFIGLDKFKSLLEIQNQYKRFYDLKRWVIEPAIKELTTKNNFEITWKTIKQGREIKQLQFFFRETKITD